MATEKKETAQRDAQGVRKQSYKRFKEGRDYEPTDAETTAALCDAFLTGFLQTEFTEVAEKYILYIKDRAAEGVRLVPDVEGFCSFAGISRETLNNWETARPGAYSDTIKRLKTSIAAFKKQLAFAGKIPPIVFATDMNNNHGYTQAAQKIDLNVGKQAAELPTAAEIAQRLPVEMSGKDPADTDGDINI
jgi:hypothetical protein